MYDRNQDEFHCTKVCLYRGLQATAKITYKTILRENLVRLGFCSCFGSLWWLQADSDCCCASEQGATLTLWSSCGRSRGGRYGEWQGVICTGETNSPVQVEKERQEAAIFCAVFWTR